MKEPRKANVEDPLNRSTSKTCPSCFKSLYSKEGNATHGIGGGYECRNNVCLLFGVARDSAPEVTMGVDHAFIPSTDLMRHVTVNGREYKPNNGSGYELKARRNYLVMIDEDNGSFSIIREAKGNRDGH